jgi:hypothetical protein
MSPRTEAGAPRVAVSRLGQGGGDLVADVGYPWTQPALMLLGPASVMAAVFPAEVADASRHPCFTTRRCTICKHSNLPAHA